MSWSGHVLRASHCWRSAGRHLINLPMPVSCLPWVTSTGWPLYRRMKGKAFLNTGHFSVPPPKLQLDSFWDRRPRGYRARGLLFLATTCFSRFAIAR